MKNKSYVNHIFVQLTTMLETQFSCKIKNMYTDNGGEFLKLHPFLAQDGINHFTNAPTPLAKWYY